MVGRGSSLPRNHSTGDSSENSLLHKPTPEDKDKGYLYPIDNEVVDDLRRITRAYVKNIGGLPIISILPRREYQKKGNTYSSFCCFVLWVLFCYNIFACQRLQCKFALIHILERWRCLFHVMKDYCVQPH